MLTARQRPYAFPREHERYIDRKTICFKCIRERRGQADVHLLVCSATISDLAIFHRHTIGCTSSSRCRKSTQTRYSVCKLFCRTSDWFARFVVRCAAGGARRDRTDDLMLAKHALSQLSYGPERSAFFPRMHSRLKWWAWEDLNFRP